MVKLTDRRRHAPYEVPFSAEFGEVLDSDAWIGFGGEMVPDDDADEAEISELKKYGKAHVIINFMKPMMSILRKQEKRYSTL